MYVTYVTKWLEHLTDRRQLFRGEGSILSVLKWANFYTINERIKIEIQNSIKNQTHIKEQKCMYVLIKFVNQ